MAAIPTTPLPPGYHNRKGKVDPELRRRFMQQMLLQTRPEAEFERLKKEDVGLVDPLAKTAANAAYMLGGPVIDAVANRDPLSILAAGEFMLDPLNKVAGVPLAKTKKMRGARKGKGTTYYHGSNTPTKPSDMRLVSSGTNTTTFGDVDVERHGIFLSDSPRFASEYGSTVTPLSVRVSKTADVASERMKFVDSLDAFDDRDMWLAAKYAQEDWQMFDGELGRRFTDYLRNKGYDSARFSETTDFGRFSDESNELTGNTLVVLKTGLIEGL